MLFNSIEFLIFMPITFFLYWFVTRSNLRLQNLLVLAASYVFYGYWDWRFLSLIIFSTIVDFFIGRQLAKTDVRVRRKALLWVSLLVNIGFLGIFKYYNFFIDNFITAFSFLGANLEARTLNIVLPVGISFYTFQTLSYTIDVYKRNIKPERDFISFAAFVSFFPQLVAGPIERASNLLPQFNKQRKFDLSDATDGMRQILWGFIKKVVIADNCAIFANEAFNQSGDMNGSSLALGVFFFTFQIYGDFSGYSDIAIGTARLFGFKLMRNFAFPYFSRDIAEFWRRWHISLSSWFRDYLYIPLGGSRVKLSKRIRNTFIIFIVSGFWHGANWTFIFWGALNALFFLPLLLSKTNRVNIGTVAQDRMLPTLNELRMMLSTFVLTMIAWVFFRADNVKHAIGVLREIMSSTLFDYPLFSDPYAAFITLLLIASFILIEWLGRSNEYAIEKIHHNIPNRAARWGTYMILGLVIIAFGNFNKTEFIYFAF